MLVLLTGLPGTGKSTIADAVGDALRACVLSADPIDDALRTAGVPNDQGKVGYELMKALARNDLDAGRSAVIDAVSPFAWVRAEWAAIAADAGTTMAVIVTTCSDPKLHRQRVASRAGAPGKVDWAGVERQVGYYEPHEGEALRLDAVDDVDTNRGLAIRYVTR